MVTSYFSLMSLEKVRILVELFIGDWLNSWLNNGSPQYGLLLWYYQFVRAETCWSLGFSFIFLSCIVYAWWQSSYVDEADHFELFSVDFPNESKEYWFEELSETASLVVYFLWYSFIDLPYFWKPNKPVLSALVIGRKSPRVSWILGERTYNPLAYLLSTKYRYKWTLWHVNFLDLTRWTLDELHAIPNVRSMAKTDTWDGNGYYFKLGRRSNLWDKTKYFFRVGLRHALRPSSRVRALGLKRAPLYLQSPYQYVYLAIKKKTKYAMSLTRIMYLRKRRRIARFYRPTLKRCKRSTWLRKKTARKMALRRKRYKYRRAVLKFLRKVCGVNLKKLNFNLRRRNSKYFNRGRFFIRYFRNIRLKGNLLPIQKEVQRHILKRGRHFELVMRPRNKFRRLRLMLFSKRKKFRRRAFRTNRPKWHRWYWKKYYKRQKNDDMLSRGALVPNDISVHEQFAPWLFALCAASCYCWEEDEWDMYEEEFEDWDLEYDQEMGEVNFEDIDMEQDKDLLTLGKPVSDTFEAIRFSENKQEIRDGDALDRQAARLADDDYDEDEIIVEEEDIDTDLLMLGVDYWAGIFEFFTDPVPIVRTDRQLHLQRGIDMPPAWGPLQDNSTNRANMLNRADGLIQAFYYHQFVDLETGVSWPNYWWDAEPKSWLYDGQPADYLSLTGANWKTFHDWYKNEYRDKKKENDYDFYLTILEVDAQTRKTRPHFHGMAFSRGYGHVPKSDAGVYYTNLIASLTEDRRELLLEYMKKVNERASREEFIADDDYLTFEGGKYNPYLHKFSNPKK